MKNLAVWKDRKWEFLFLAGIFIFYIMWAYIQPLNASPDEEMRYLIPQYIYKYGRLPVGDDPEILNMIWGNSYGFNPITSYILSAAFMKIISLFTVDNFALLMAARMVSVLFGTATAFMTIKISKQLFENNYCRWLFVILVTMLPQAILISTYVNIDSMAIFATSCIIYSWIIGMKSEWTYKNCIFLGVSLSLCFLSYYNAYGFLICSFVLFIMSIFISSYKNKKVSQNLKYIIIKGLIVLTVIIILAGWWFVRSYILYDGDIFGMNACNICAEKYAIMEFKPSMKETYITRGESLARMLLGDRWIVNSIISYIGCFGSMDILLKKWMYFIWIIIIFVAIIGVIINLVETLKQKDGRKINNTSIFNVTMFISMLFPIIISAYYSYTSDFQPQGRYWLPMLIPCMYFVTMGINKIMGIIGRNNDKVKQTGIIVIASLVLFVGIMSYITVFAPYYIV